MNIPRYEGWKFVALAGLAVVVVTSIPQIMVWAQRGRDWQGFYAYSDPDELAYSAYLRSIIAGRPRRNNPYLRSESPNAVASGENFYSIQFLPPYAVALIARLASLSASTAFILLLPIMAFISYLAVFWLLFHVTGDSKVAAVGALMVLLCGVLVSENPFAAVRSYATFAFLRRYIPAVPFPLLFLFCLFAWNAFTRRARRSLLWSLAAGVTLGLMIYSYFYLWTAAAAWLFCFGLMWVMSRPADRPHVLKCLTVVGVVALGALLPYAWMLSHRAETTDATSILNFTHAPDVFRSTVVVGALVLIALARAARRGIISWSSPAALFAASCVATPFVVFNQQLITGRSLQPFHYEQFVVNYLLLVGVVITYHLIWQTLRIRLGLWVVFALAVGLATGIRSAKESLEVNLYCDESMPVFKKLDELGAQIPLNGSVLYDHSLLAASGSTSSSASVLWSPYMYTFGSTSAAEEMERFYQYLYYMGVDQKAFEKKLKEDLRVAATVFGFHRLNPKLTEKFQPVSDEEIRARGEAYGTYFKGFSQEQASRWPLSYVVLVGDRSYDLSNLDRWYQRDDEERIGGAVLYRVKLRNEANQIGGK